MNIEQTRLNMIERQIRCAGVSMPDVLDLLAVVKREHFVPQEYAHLAFADLEIPLPGGENMLTPRVEALVLQAVAVKTHENVLEIGAGSGYMAALLAHRARHVTTVEIDPVLKNLAQTKLSGYGIANVEVALGNGALGWGGSAGSYDVIVVSGSLPYLPRSLLRQIKIGGRMAAFVGLAPTMTAQIVTRLSGTVYDTVKLFETSVKPLRNTSLSSSFNFHA